MHWQHEGKPNEFFSSAHLARGEFDFSIRHSGAIKATTFDHMEHTQNSVAYFACCFYPTILLQE